MSAVWLTVAALCVGTIAIKAAGPVAIGGRRPSARASAVIGLVAPALLAALIVYEALNDDGQGLVLDARLVGVAVAGLGLLARLPVLVVVVLAAAATAAARALG